MRKVIYAFLFLGIFISCADGNSSLREGDVLFQDLNPGKIADAIENVTKSGETRSFSHCGMVVVADGELMVAEAIGDSVQVTPIDKFYSRSGKENVVAKRLKPEYTDMIPSAVAFILSQRGKPYDEEYLLDNGKWYCSELITESFRKDSASIFTFHPMTFKIPGSDVFPLAWIDHYLNLGISIPEGSLGNNPNDLFNSDVLVDIALISSHPGTDAPKPRILVSTDIGGSDPDDNQSMTHLMMYSDLFNIEGIVSSPSYGAGNKEEILRMIDLYEKDFPKLIKHNKDLATPDYLRSVTMQGQKGASPFKGFNKPTEGSEWIVKCARKKNKQPLWVLVWGGLEDLAQALHDAPDIQKNIKVYWIGGPNKKWSANTYAYIAENFPDLWFIEVNASYYGFFSHSDMPDSVKKSDYYDRAIKGAGYLGEDFKNYYSGEVKMGDTPSLLYMMNGDPNDPYSESWGGSFEKISHSSRIICHEPTTLKDSVAYCSILEFHFIGPKIDIPEDSVCFKMEVPYGKTFQTWPGYYLGDGDYVIRYIPKKAEILTYKFTSEIPELNGKEGTLVVTNCWPGEKHSSDYKLGKNWYSDKTDPALYDGNLQGGKTIQKWSKDVLDDWAKRWEWLK